MSYVITLVGYVPEARYDGNPWTQAQIAYSAIQAGPFTRFDTLALSPVDPDPTKPLTRNLTTSLSPAPTGWFQVTFVDAAGNLEPTDPVSRSADSSVIAPGSSQTSTLRDAPPYLANNLTWRLINDADGTVVIAESADGIVEIDTGQDAPDSRYDRAFTAPATPGRYLAIWRYDLQEIAQTIEVATGSATTFASTADVASRLGRALSTTEDENVPFLLTLATSVIADAAGYDDGWAATLTRVPRMLRLLSVELVCRTLPNPSQYSQVRQQVGSYSFAMTQDTPGMKLADAEVLMVRRAVHGRTTDSVQVDSSFDRAQDEYWLRKQSVRYTDPDDPAEIIR